MRTINVGDIVEWRNGRLLFMFEVEKIIALTTDYGLTSMYVYPILGSVVAIRSGKTDIVVDPPENFLLDECKKATTFSILLYEKSGSV